MCEYCKKEADGDNVAKDIIYERIGDDGKGEPFITINACIMYSEHKPRFTAGVYFFEGANDFYSSTPINYCPVCGRDLRHT